MATDSVNEPNVSERNVSEANAGESNAGESAATILDSIRGTRDALSVHRVFGEPYELDGVTVIPVARVAGGAGGGGGEGTDEKQSGSGFGTGFGLQAYPVGIYEVRNGTVTWTPTVDVTRLWKGRQLLAGILAVCATLIVARSGRQNAPRA